MFFSVAVGLIQDYLAHEFNQMDDLVILLVKAIFSNRWTYVMSLFSNLTSYKLLIALAVLLLIWIIFKGLDKFLEIQFTLLVMLGGAFLQFILRNIFRRIGPHASQLTSMLKYTFPSERSLMAIVILGFIAFMIIRHSRRTWIGTVAIITALLICILTGLSPLFFQSEYSTDVFAGYIFGGAWLTNNIVLLEVYRILHKIQL